MLFIRCWTKCGEWPSQSPVHIRDPGATILCLFGADHEKLTFRFQSLDQKLAGVEAAKVIK